MLKCLHFLWVFISFQMPEVINAQIPTIYQVPKLPILSTQNVIQPSDDREEDEEEDEHCNQFVHDSQSKEPLLPCHESPNEDNEQFNNTTYNLEHVSSEASDKSISSSSHDSLWTNQCPVLTDAITQCNVNLEDDLCGL